MLMLQDTGSVSLLLQPPGLPKFGTGQTYGGPSGAEGFSTVDNALFSTLPGARMLCQKAMSHMARGSKVDFRSPYSHRISG